MDRLIAMKIKQNDGSYSDEIPISALAKNIGYDDDMTYSLLDILGNVNIAEGSLQDQITRLFNQKANATAVSVLESRINNLAQLE